MTDSADAAQISIDQSLLVEATWMLREGHRTVALLTAMKACEVVVTRAVRKKLGELNLDRMYDCLRESVGGFDLRNENALHTYEALTGHTIQRDATEMGIWSKYVDALNHLDKIFFQGLDLQRDDAAADLDVATRFVDFVARANDL